MNPFAHRLPLIQPTRRLVFQFRGAVSEIYVHLPSGRRSKVHSGALNRFHLSSMRAMHEEASAPTDDAQQVGPDTHRSGQGSAVHSRGTERKTAAHAELRLLDMGCRVTEVD